MIVEIDQRSDVPIYEQLHRQFIAAIAGDELSPGDSLPSVRSLAVDLGINLHTAWQGFHGLPTGMRCSVSRCRPPPIPIRAFANTKSRFREL